MVKLCDFGAALAVKASTASIIAVRAMVVVSLARKLNSN
jgi:hypothetical protein